jgi:rubrerythrin
MNAIIIVLAFLLGFPTSGYCQSGTGKTPEEIKIAYNKESTASAKYAGYAEAARKENLPMIAKLFEATSKAESIHAANHKRVMEVLSVKVDVPVIEHFEVKSTAENLAEAIKGETYEFATMYPAFLKTAESEKISEAIVTYRYALDTEKRHAILYQSVLEKLQSKKTDSIPSTWYVCPTCGNTYDPTGVKISCEFCGTLKPRFIVFQTK